MQKSLKYSHYFSQDTVVLGGTHQVNDWNTKARDEDRSFIWNGCSAMMPAAIKDVEHVKDWVGLRPGRNAVRLECDKHQPKVNCLGNSMPQQYN
jgi:D-amino-acid oxidase